MYAAKAKGQEEKDFIAQVRGVITQLIQTPWDPNDKSAPEPHLLGFDVTTHSGLGNGDPKKIRCMKKYTAPKEQSPEVLRYAFYLLAAGNDLFKEKGGKRYGYEVTIRDNTLYLTEREMPSSYSLPYRPVPSDSVVISNEQFDAEIFNYINSYLQQTFVEMQKGEKWTKADVYFVDWLEGTSGGLCNYQTIPPALKTAPTAMFYIYNHIALSEELLNHFGDKDCDINFLLRVLAKQLGLVDSIYEPKESDKIMFTNNKPAHIKTRQQLERERARIIGDKRGTNFAGTTVIFGRQEDIEKLIATLQKELHFGKAATLTKGVGEVKASVPALPAAPDKDRLSASPDGDEDDLAAAIRLSLELSAATSVASQAAPAGIVIDHVKEFKDEKQLDEEARRRLRGPAKLSAQDVLKIMSQIAPEIAEIVTKEFGGITYPNGNSLDPQYCTLENIRARAKPLIDKIKSLDPKAESSKVEKSRNLLLLNIWLGVLHTLIATRLIELQPSPELGISSARSLPVEGVPAPKTESKREIKTTAPSSPPKMDPGFEALGKILPDVVALYIAENKPLPQITIPYPGETLDALKTEAGRIMQRISKLVPKSARYDQDHKNLTRSLDNLIGRLRRLIEVVPQASAVSTSEMKQQVPEAKRAQPKSSVTPLAASLSDSIGIQPPPAARSAVDEFIAGLGDVDPEVLADIRRQAAQLNP